jgi:hypothetical protein
MGTAASILNCCFPLKVIFSYEIEEEIAGYHFMYVLFHFHLTQAFVYITLNSLKKYILSHQPVSTLQNSYELIC